jgi:hypothetical protein
MIFLFFLNEIDNKISNATKINFVSSVDIEIPKVISLKNSAIMDTFGDIGTFGGRVK